MSTVQKREPISVNEYLAGEEVSEIRHEYLEGYVYAMVGGTLNHSQIQMNIARFIENQLEETDCSVHGGHFKLRIETKTGTRFYYPDIHIVCDRIPGSQLFHNSPPVIFEVLSSSTRRADESEKKDHYLSIESLRAYVLVEQDFPQVTVYRRSESGFDREVYDKLDEVISFEKPSFKLSLAEIYKKVSFDSD